LPESQAGTGRHKCATCAYEIGFRAGLQDQSFYSKVFSRMTGKPGVAAASPQIGGELSIVSPPELASPPTISASNFKARKVFNRSLKEHRNLQLGRAGELLVLEYEWHFLEAAGKLHLARQIVHTSEVEGDGAGFDIRSYEPNGKTKYIEVKTTRGTIDMPFYVTQNELEFSTKHHDQYYLIRIFDFDLAKITGSAYIIQGNLNKMFNLAATVYRASRR